MIPTPVRSGDTLPSSSARSRRLLLALLLALAGPFAGPLGAASAGSRAPTESIDASRPESIKAAVEAAAARGLAKVVVPAGEYRLTVRDNWHLRFDKLNDIEIDATGATFVLTDPYARGIGFFECRNVTLRGARVTRSHPTASQATIEAIDPTGASVDIRIAKGYGGDLLDRKKFPTFWASLWTAAGEPIGMMRAQTPPQIEQLAPDLYRVRLHDTAPKIQEATGVTVVPGMRLAWRGPVTDDIRPQDSEALKFIDITVAGGSGMVFHEMGGKGGHHYLRCKITYPDKPAGADEAPLIATSADGLHSHDTMRGPILENCVFEGVSDDAIAIHGTYAMAAEAADRRLVAWVFHESRDRLYCRAGETLRFYDPRGVLAGEAKVVSVKPLAGYKPSFKPDSVYRAFQDPSRDGFVEVMLDRPAPAVPPGSLVSNVDRMGGGYVVRDCVIRRCGARGVMAKAARGLIEGSTFEDLNRAGVEFMSEMEVWSESDYATDTIVRNNVFRRVSTNRQPGYLRHPGALTIFNFRTTSDEADLSRRHGAYVPFPGGHRNLTIEGNTFEEIDGPNMIITSAQNVVVKNNRFLKPMRRATTLGREKGVDTGALLWVSQSSDVTVSGNVVRDAGPFLKTPVKATDSARGAGFEDGIK